MIIGSDIHVVQLEPGTIVFKKLGLATDQLWTGFINSIRFRSKVDGFSNIEYRFDKELLSIFKIINFDKKCMDYKKNLNGEIDNGKFQIKKETDFILSCSYYL